MDIQKILHDHPKWLAGESDGVRANLGGADLYGAELSGADLRRAYLRDVDLRGADLSGADLSGAYLHGADLSDADLSRANLSGADLSDVDLRRTDLSRANLSGADLVGAHLNGANLNYTNLSGARNLLNPATWLAENFEHDSLGYIVYKAIGNTTYDPPEHWRIEPGAYIEEVVNPLPTVECGCGVNFGTLAWVRKNHPGSVIWRCRIRWTDLPGVVVPYGTDGKARCSRLELIEIVA